MRGRQKRSRTAGLLLSSALGTGLLAGTFSFPGQALAQQQSGGDAEEVVVSGKFLSTDKTSSNKLGSSDLDTPTSVSAYTGDFLKAIDTTEVSDLYRYMTGLQRAGSTGYDMTLRGFRTTIQDRNSILTDGLPGQAVRFGSPPTIGTDHIEVVKGPASLYYGQVQPGGFVNIITKKPSAEDSTELSIRGSDSTDTRAKGGDFGIDSTGAIDDDKTLFYRFIAQKGYDNTFRNNGFERADYLAPSITWNATDNTSVTAQYEYRQVETNYNNIYLIAPRNNVRYIPSYKDNYSAPSDWQTESGAVGSLAVVHSFGDGIDWTTSLRDVEHYDKAHAFDLAAASNAPLALNATIPIRARGQTNYREYAFGDTNVVLPFDSWLFHNKLVVGATLGRETDDLARTQFATTKYSVSVLNPSFANIPSVDSFAPGSLQDQHTTTDAMGTYLSDLITLTDEWKAQIGVRLNREIGSFEDPLNPKTSPPRSEDNNSATKSAGLIYEPSKEWSFYTSYSTSFAAVPLTTVGLTQGGITNYRFSPTTGRSVEIGSKLATEDNRLTLTAALYRIDRSNVNEVYAAPAGGPNLCPATISATCSVQVGVERSNGAELELTAQPLPEWQIIAGYAYTRAKVQSNDTQPITVGETLANAPENAAQIWSRYDIADGDFRGLGFGVGGSYIGDRVAYNGITVESTKTKLPHYTVADAVIFYEIDDRYFINFKVNNIFNKIYYESGNSVSNILSIQPGSPRVMMLSGRVRF